jgi:hypothetical protein
MARYHTVPHNSSKFGAGAQTAAPGSRSTLHATRPPGIGVAASASVPLGMSGTTRHGIVGVFGCSGGGVIAGGNGSGNGDMGTRGYGYGVRGTGLGVGVGCGDRGGGGGGALG